MDIFLKLKHWQIFLLVVGIPILIEIIDSILVISNTGEAFISSAVFRFILIIPFLTFYFWIYSVGYLLNKKISNELKTKSGYFALSVWTSAFSSFFLLIFVFFTWDNWDTFIIESTLTYILFGIVVFLAIATLFLALSYVAKTLVRAERRANIKSSDFYGEFVMTLFFPIGIWILQPRINALHNKDSREL